MIDKMKIFIDLVKTDPSESDEMLLKKVAPSSGNSTNQASSANNSNVHDLINSAEMKSEPDEPTGVSEDVINCQMVQFLGHKLPIWSTYFLCS